MRSKKKEFFLVHQADLILLGSALSLALALIVNLTQVVYPIPLDVSRVGLYGMSFMIVFTAFALVRARLFEMRLVLLRSVAFLVFSVLIGNLAVIAVVLLVTAVFHLSIDPRTVVISVVVATFISMGFDSLRKVFERITDKILFRGRYSPDAVLGRITEVMVSARGLDDMGKGLLRVLTEEFRIEKAGLLLFDRVTNDTWIPFGFPEELPRADRAVLRDEPITSHVLFDELPEGALKQTFRRYDIATVFLIQKNDMPIALLLLGTKGSGEPLHEEDVTFLDLLASEMAIGIQNAQSFSMIWGFNKQLEAKVEERTIELTHAQEAEHARTEEVLRLKDEFVFLAVHELRTPITGLRGFLELSEEYLAQAPEDIKENFTAIQETSAHLNQLVNDLLEIARSESGTIAITVAPHAFSPVLDKVLESVAPIIEKKEVVLSVRVDPLPPVLCDEAKLREILTNLISNATKYNRDGGSITITVYHASDKQEMVFSVRDSGYGIPKDKQSQVFQKFFRAGTKGTEGVIGTGLGLFLTRMLIEKMGGKISFTSVEQEGTTFTFTLPLAPNSVAS